MNEEELTWNSSTKMCRMPSRTSGAFVKSRSPQTRRSSKSSAPEALSAS